MKKLRVLDLFSGIGGFSLGLERTGGFETAAFCEIDKKARQVLRKHWPDVPIFDDVVNLKGDQIGTIDVICGGFPCQDISYAGKGAGLEGARSGLWWEFHRLIKEIRPSWVIAENVSALRSRGLDEVLRSLSEIGYDAEWHCIPASAVGAHHRRDRIWIVAYPNSYDGRDRSSSITSNGQTRVELGRSGERFIEPRTNQNVAYANNAGDRTSECNSYPHRTQTVEGREIEPLSRIGGCSKDVAYPHGTRLEGCQETGNFSRCWTQINEQLARCRESDNYWSVESGVGRVVDGLSGRVDRIKQLGNAVVPQIPQIIGSAILSCNI